jgi:predicted transcriptional regulator of viral defense system
MDRMSGSLDPTVLHLLRQQHGLITRAQAAEAGLGDRAVRYLVRSGRLERVGPGLYGAPGHRPS